MGMEESSRTSTGASAIIHLLTLKAFFFVSDQDHEILSAMRECRSCILAERLDINLLISPKYVLISFSFMGSEACNKSATLRALRALGDCMLEVFDPRNDECVLVLVCVIGQTREVASELTSSS